MWVRRHSGRLLIRSVSEGGEEDRKLLSALSIILTLLFLSSLSSSVSHSPLPSHSVLSVEIKRKYSIIAIIADMMCFDYQL